MSRRDTIIIAVLVNAGLLLVLFATAMRSKKEEPVQVVATEVVAEPKEGALTETIASVPTVPENILDGTIGAIPQEGAQTPVTASLGEEIDLSEPVVEQVVEPVPQPVVAVVEIKKEEPEVATITVKKGDVLEKIARANKSTVSAIMKANNLTSSNLKIGQVLKVPMTKKGEAQTVVKNETTEGSKEYYTVKEGDSPWLIASRNKVKLEELLRLNDMDEQKARRLRPGDKLRIR